jgi:iron complex outermembrane receptor protein
MTNALHPQCNLTTVKTVLFSQKKFKQKLLTASVALLAAAQVSAQSNEPAKPGTLEEVTVTAQRRSELAVDVPISITSISADQLGKGAIQQLGDISKMTPSLRFDNASSFSQPTIRGVGTAVAVAGGSSNVGIYTDGFYSPNPLAADFDLLNIASVQVLKGPQGTLFGRNSTGGAILVTTKEPSNTPSFDAEAAYGNYNTQRYQLYATGGLNEKAAFDVAGLLRKSDGFVDNIITGSDTDAEYENSSVRVGAKLEPTEKISVLLHYSYSDRDDNSFTATNAFERNGQPLSVAAAFYGARVATDSDEVSNNYKPTFTGRSSASQATIKVDLDSALLTSYTQYRDERGRHTADFDMSASTAPQAIFHYKYDNVDTVFTQEFLLASTGDSRLQWTTGLFYFANGSFFENNQVSFGGPFIHNGGSGVDVSTIAAYGDTTYALRDDLFLTFGLRYSKDAIDNAYFLNPPSLGNENLIQTDVPDIDDEHVTPRLVLRYKPNDSSSVYASYTEGYKSAILNVGGGTLTDIKVEPEEIKAYEVGYKYSSGAIIADVSTYYYDYKDLQIASYVNTASLIQNAATSTVYGVDGQIRYAITEEWEANIGVAYVHTKYDEFENSQIWVNFAPDYADASGNQMQRAPEFTGTLGLSYRTELAGGQLVTSGTIYHTSDFYFDSSNDYKQDGYNLLGLRAAWTDPSDHYTFAVFGDNLTDEEYRNQALPQFYGTLSSWGAPRTYGVSVAVHY